MQRESSRDSTHFPSLRFCFLRHGVKQYQTNQIRRVTASGRQTNPFAWALGERSRLTRRRAGELLSPPACPPAALQLSEPSRCFPGESLIQSIGRHSLDSGEANQSKRLIYFSVSMIV